MNPLKKRLPFGIQHLQDKESKNNLGKLKPALKDFYMKQHSCMVEIGIQEYKDFYSKYRSLLNLYEFQSSISIKWNSYLISMFVKHLGSKVLKHHLQQGRSLHWLLSIIIHVQPRQHACWLTALEILEGKLLRMLYTKPGGEHSPLNLSQVH